MSLLQTLARKANVAGDIRRTTGRRDTAKKATTLAAELADFVQGKVHQQNKLGQALDVAAFLAQFIPTGGKPLSWLLKGAGTASDAGARKKRKEEVEQKIADLEANKLFKGSQGDYLQTQAVNLEDMMSGALKSEKQADVTEALMFVAGEFLKGDAGQKIADKLSPERVVMPSGEASSPAVGKIGSKFLSNLLGGTEEIMTAPILSQAKASPSWFDLYQVASPHAMRAMTGPPAEARLPRAVASRPGSIRRRIS